MKIINKVLETKIRFDCINEPKISNWAGDMNKRYFDGVHSALWLIMIFKWQKQFIGCNVTQSKQFETAYLDMPN